MWGNAAAPKVAAVGDIAAVANVVAPRCEVAGDTVAAPKVDAAGDIAALVNAVCRQTEADDAPKVEAVGDVAVAAALDVAPYIEGVADAVVDSADVKTGSNLPPELVVVEQRIVLFAANFASGVALYPFATVADSDRLFQTHLALVGAPTILILIVWVRFANSLDRPLSKMLSHQKAMVPFPHLLLQFALPVQFAAWKISGDVFFLASRRWLTLCP